MLPLTIWMNMPSPYQSDLFRDLVASGKVELQVIFARKLSQERQQLGWPRELAGYPYYFLPSNSLVDALRLAWRQRRRFHIVNGLWVESSFAAALVMLALSGSAYVIYSEAPDPALHRTAGKKLLRTVFGRGIARRAAGVLPVSHFGVEFYRTLGVSEDRIYPFGYFRAGAQPPRHLQSQHKIEVVYIGQVIYRKGIDLLLEAIAPLFQEYPMLSLTIIGTGDLLDTLQEQTHTLDIREQVTFAGALSSEKILTRLQEASILVLPSRWDGWGMVVNEALSVGVPVIVSDRCGAADLIRNGENGYIFQNEDVAALRQCLTSFLSRRATWEDLCANATAVGSRISTEAVAPYLIRCLQHMTGMQQERPQPPWL